MVFDAFPNLRTESALRALVERAAHRGRPRPHRHNARELVELAADRGVSVTGVTKAMRGMPALAGVCSRRGRRTLGDSRIENIERLRAGGIDAPIMMIRSPMPSQVARVVNAADMSCSGEVDVVALLVGRGASSRAVCTASCSWSSSATCVKGSCPSMCMMRSRAASTFRTSEFAASAPTLRAAAASSPAIATWACCRILRDSIEAKFDIALEVVSGGNSATSSGLVPTDTRRQDQQSPPRRVDPARAATRSRRPDRRAAPRHGDGLRRGDRVEVQAPSGLGRSRAYSIRSAWERRRRLEQRMAGDRGARSPRHRPDALSAPAGLRILAASSDHLVLASDQPLAIGSEIAFRPGLLSARPCHDRRPRCLRRAAEAVPEARSESRVAHRAVSLQECRPSGGHCA